MGISRLFLPLFLFILPIAAGCSNLPNQGFTTVYTTENPDAEEVLTMDPEADIFQFDGLIYQTGIDWVEELTLTKGEQVGEIKSRNTEDTNFENEMSNKLPVGAKVFTTAENEGLMLLIESEGEILKYYSLVEG